MNVCPYCGEDQVDGTNGFFCGSLYGSSREFYRTATCHRLEEKPRRSVEIIKQLESERDALKAYVKRLEDALGSIQEYWNRDNNEGAMQDACWHAINTAIDALEAKESKP